MQTWQRLFILLSQRVGGSSVSMVVSIPSAIDRAILEQYADRQDHDLPCTPVSIRQIHCRSCVTVSVIEPRHRLDAEQLAKSSRDRQRRRLPCSLTAFQACSTRCEIETTSLMPTWMQCCAAKSSHDHWRGNKSTDPLLLWHLLPLIHDGDRLIYAFKDWHNSQCAEHDGVIATADIPVPRILRGLILQSHLCRGRFMWWNTCGPYWLFASWQMDKRVAYEADCLRFLYSLCGRSISLIFSTSHLLYIPLWSLLWTWYSLSLTTWKVIP